MVALFQMVYVGPPMIYYGTEAGMWGGDDPSNRMPMVWPEKSYEPQDNPSQDGNDQADTVEFDRAIHDYYRMAFHLRRRHSALQDFGPSELLLADDRTQVLVMRRWNEEETLYVVFDRGNEPREWQLRDAGDEPIIQIFAASGGDDNSRLSTINGKTTVSVAAHEAVVLLQQHTPPSQNRKRSGSRRRLPD